MGFLYILDNPSRSILPPKTVIWNERMSATSDSTWRLEAGGREDGCCVSADESLQRRPSSLETCTRTHVAPGGYERMDSPIV
jgi:hypothetical protein